MVNRIINWFKTKIKSKIKKSDVKKTSLRRIFNKIFLAVRLEKTMNFILLPRNFNYERHISIFPPQNYGFRDDRNGGFKVMRMLYILWLIVETASRSEKNYKPGGFVAVSGKKFQKRVQNYNAYIQYLIKTEVIECDEQYEENVISKGYRYSEQYVNEPFELKILNNSSSSIIGEVAEFPYLTYWYSQNNLKIDAENAFKDAFGRYRLIREDPSLWSINKDGKKIEPLPQYLSAINLIAKFDDAIYNLKLSPKVHRLYSTLTQMPSKYRKYIFYNGNQLHGVDIKNCQSYVSCLILNPEFWKANSTLPLNFFSLPQNVIDLFSPDLIIMIGERLAEINSPDIFNEYINLVSKGEIYNDMINWAKDEKDKVVSRETVKKVVFLSIFSPVNSRKTWLSAYYDDKFPELVDFFNLIKTDNNNTNNFDDNETDLNEIETDDAVEVVEADEIDETKPHARLSILFQSIESQIVLHRCCKRIFEEKNKTVPVFTIHDCIVTTEENVEYLKEVVIEEFTANIGYPPPLGIENWV